MSLVIATKNKGLIKLVIFQLAKKETDLQYLTSLKEGKSENKREWMVRRT